MIGEREKLNQGPKDGVKSCPVLVKEKCISRVCGINTKHSHKLSISVGKEHDQHHKPDLCHDEWAKHRLTYLSTALHRLSQAMVSVSEWHKNNISVLYTSSAVLCYFNISEQCRLLLLYVVKMKRR